MVWFAGIVLLTHALVHYNVWLRPAAPATTAVGGGGAQPTPSPLRDLNPRRSWLAERLGAQAATQASATLLATAAAALLAAAGVGVVTGAAWAPNVAVAGAAVSLLLCAGFFNRWLTLGILVDVAIIAFALAA